VSIKTPVAVDIRDLQPGSLFANTSTWWPYHYPRLDLSCPPGTLFLCLKKTDSLFVEVFILREGEKMTLSTLKFVCFSRCDIILYAR